MTDKAPMILDYIENLSLSAEEIEQQDYACQTLARLAEGLTWLNKEISEVERVAKNEAMKKNVRMSLPGDFLKARPLSQVSCAFQWYAASICNYVQLVGWLAYRDTNQAKAYVKRILPNISTYRNKVAAHFALTDPRKDDDEGSLTSSVISNLFYADGHLYAGAIYPDTINGRKTQPNQIHSWSVTTVHQRLIKRYWPNGTPKAHGALMLPAGDSMQILVNFDSPL